MRIRTKKLLSLLVIVALLLITMASFPASSVKITPDDQDGDGLSDSEENNTGTEIDNPDTDGDGIIDSEDENPKEHDKFIQYDDDAWDRREDANSMMNIFLFVLLLSFAIFSLLAGVFTAYFGAGKSRAIGGVLLAIGLIVILFWVYFGILSDYPNDTLLGIVHWEAAKTLEAFITVLSAVIGAVIAVVLFLVAIMKS